MVAGVGAGERGEGVMEESGVEENSTEIFYTNIV